MRARTFFWIPFIFSIGTISWALLASGLILLAALILTPALRDVRTAETTRNDYKASLDLLDQQIALQADFAQAATTDPVLMDRLASRQLNLNRKDQDILILDPAMQNRDRSVKSLLAESLQPVEPKPATPVNPLLEMAITPTLKPMLITLACAAICLSFFLGVKYERV